MKDIAIKVDQLIERLRSLIITSLKVDGLPSIGYLPFVRQEQNFYVFTSNLSEHGENLAQGRQASIMFIEDEQRAKTITVRKRAIFDIDYCLIPTDQSIIDLFQIQHDEIYDMLRKMSDFALYEILLKNGRFVQGYGSAFIQNEKGNWEHLSAEKLKR